MLLLLNLILSILCVITQAYHVPTARSPLKTSPRISSILSQGSIPTASAFSFHTPLVTNCKSRSHSPNNIISYALAASSSSSSSASSSSSQSSFPTYSSKDTYSAKVDLSPALFIKLLSNLYVRVSSELSQKLFGEYSLSLVMRPVLTKAVSSFIGFIIGDVFAQMLLGGGAKFNSMRCLRMGLFGGFIHGPLGHFFYRFLEHRLPGSTPSIITSKVLLDQALWSPTMSTLLISFVGIAAGSSPSIISRNIGRLLSQAMLLSWVMWPMAHFVNFRFILPRQRLMYFNSVQIVFNALISMVVNRPFVF